MKILDAKNALHTTFNTLAIHLNQENTQKTPFLPPAALRVFKRKNFSLFKNIELFHISRLANLRRTRFFQKIAKCPFLERTTFYFFLFSRRGNSTEPLLNLKTKALFLFGWDDVPGDPLTFVQELLLFCAPLFESKWSSFFWR